MNATELAKLTIKELKEIAQEKGIEVIGDKRSKTTWVLAIETFQTEQPIIETIESPFELAIESDSIDSPLSTLEPKPQALEPNSQVSEQTAPLPMRGASTVALVVVLAFGMAFLVIKTGFTSIAWVIAALVPLALRLWRYLFPDPKHQDSIDYSPLPAG